MSENMKLNIGGVSGRMILDENKRHIATAGTPSEADHIVKCVNMHDELVEALKFYADETLWNNGRFEAGLSEDGGHNVLTMIPGDVHNDHGKIARETLKKAGAL